MHPYCFYACFFCLLQYVFRDFGLRDDGQRVLVRVLQIGGGLCDGVFFLLDGDGFGGGV